MADREQQIKMQKSNRKMTTQKSNIQYLAARPARRGEPGFVGLCRVEKMKNKPNCNGRRQNTGDRSQKEIFKTKPMLI
jgi:CDGSH-type Zn-finger protein